jgi:predicted RNase H-like HicB family nuclease
MMAIRNTREKPAMTFQVTLERDEDGAWVVECPAIPGCVSQGKSRDEALENIKDAIKLCLESRITLGMSVPPTVNI